MYALCRTMPAVSPQGEWGYGFCRGIGNEEGMLNKKRERIIYLEDIFRVSGFRKGGAAASA